MGNIEANWCKSCTKGAEVGNANLDRDFIHIKNEFENTNLDQRLTHVKNNLENKVESKEAFKNRMDSFICKNNRK